MKSICFITTIPMTLDMFILKMSKYLYKNGDYKITFISNNEESEFKDKLPNYINFIPIKMKRGISISGITSVYQLYKIFKKEKYDLIQYCTPNASLYSSLAGRLAKIKNRLYCQWGIRYVGFKGIKRKIFKLLEKITCYNSTWIEPDSYGNLEFSYKEGLYDKSKSSVIWNGSASGVDLKKFDIEKKDLWKKEIRIKYNIDNELVIGFVGRIDRDKGINELLEAYRNLNKENSEVIKTKLNNKYKIIIFALSFASIFVYGLVLKKLGGSLPFVDSASTVFAITAQILCIKRCSEQWIMWILVNILNISIWYINFSSGGDNIATLLMWSVYLVNALFMLIKWYKEANNKN